MDFLAHAIAQGLVDELVTLHAVAAGELRRHNERLEVLAVADHLHVIAREPGLDSVLHALRSDQFRFSFYVLSL